MPDAPHAPTTPSPAPTGEGGEVARTEDADRKRWPMVIAGVAALLVVGGVAWIFFRDPRGTATEPIRFDDPAATKMTGPDAAHPPDSAPDVALTWFDGSTSSVSDLRGTPTVLNFYAKWCEPCRLELPAFAEAHQTYGDDVQFVGVDETEAQEDGQEAADEAGITYPLALDKSGEVLLEFGGVSMPTTVFLDADGKIVRTWSGQIPEKQLHAIIEGELLG